MEQWPLTYSFSEPDKKEIIKEWEESHKEDAKSVKMMWRAAYTYSRDLSAIRLSVFPPLVCSLRVTPGHLATSCRRLCPYHLGLY